MSGVRRVAVGAVLVPSLAALAAAQATPEEWGLGIADRLARLLPGAVSGVVGRLPWDPSESHEAQKSAPCTNMGCAAYQYVDVSQSWRIDDPRAAKEYEQLAAENARYLKRAEELGRKATPEQLVELQSGIERAEERQKQLQSASRSVEVRFRVNLPAEERQDPGTKPAGTIQGFPFYRVPDGGDVHLRVWVGPKGFKNATIPAEKTSRTEVKGILVELQLYSKPGFVAQDEPIARRLLEGIDYAALAGLLAP